MPARRIPNKLKAAPDRVEPTKNISLGIDPDEPAPSFLGPVAAEEWTRVLAVNRLHPTYIQHNDRALLVAYCNAWAVFLRCAADVEVEGPTQPGRSKPDQVRRANVSSASARIMFQAQEAMRKACREMGFSPDSRGKIPFGPREDGDAGGIWDWD